MDDEKRNMDELFSNGKMIPPGHPQCRCAVDYKEIPETNLNPGQNGRTLDSEILGQYTGERLTEHQQNCIIAVQDKKPRPISEIFVNELMEIQGRRLQYGQEKEFDRDTGTIKARKVENFIQNSLYVADGIKVSKTVLRKINSRISEAKAIMGITDICKIPMVVASSKRNIAAYNPRTDVIFVSPEFGKRHISQELQAEFACPANPISTLVHELFHWLDAYEYRERGGIINDVEIYIILQREISRNCLETIGYDPADVYATKTNISYYAYRSHINNNFEELFTEFRTKQLLEG